MGFDKKKLVHVKYINIIKNMYEGAVINIKIGDDLSSKFFIMIELHQGSTLTFLLFAIVMYELTRVSWYILSANDIVLVDETRARINDKVKLWNIFYNLTILVSVDQKVSV